MDPVMQGAVVKVEPELEDALYFGYEEESALVDSLLSNTFVRSAGADSLGYSKSKKNKIPDLTKRDGSNRVIKPKLKLATVLPPKQNHKDPHRPATMHTSMIAKRQAEKRHRQRYGTPDSDDDPDFVDKHAKKSKSNKKSDGAPLKAAKKSAETSLEPTKCNECEKIFPSRRNLTRHIQQVHTVEPQKCEQCGKDFKNTALLQVHNRRNHPKSSEGKATREARLERNRNGRQRVRKPGQGEAEAGIGTGEPVHNDESIEPNNELANLPTVSTTTKTGVICDICNKSFNISRDLNRHKKLVHTNAPEMCEQCGKEFKNRVLLKVHLRRTHPANDTKRKERLIKERARKQLRKSKQLEDELNSGTVFTCTLCNEEFNLKKDLKSHERQVHQRKEVTCPKCPKTYGWMESLRAHMKRVHGSKKGLNSQVQCEICYEMFKSKATLKVHKKYIHPQIERVVNPESGLPSITINNESLLTCEVCKAEFRKPGELRRHSRRHEPDDGTRHRCEKCPSEFRWLDGLKMHMIRVHTNQERSVCDFCGKTFAHRTNLFWHRKRHTNEKIYHCQFCPKSFKLQPDQRNHEKKYHGKGGIFPCGLCEGLEFKSPMFLEKHTYFYHPELVKNQGVGRRRPRAISKPSAIPTLEPQQANSDTLFSDLNAENQVDIPSSSTPSRLENLQSQESKITSEMESKKPFMTDPTSFSTNIDAGNVPSAAASSRSSLSTTKKTEPLGEYPDFPDNNDDLNDWFGFDHQGPSSELSPPSTPAPYDIKPIIRLDVENTDLDTSFLTEYNPTHKKTKLYDCPKLFMKPVVKLKQFLAETHRSGALYCEICLINFLHPPYLAKHLKSIHGITYTPKKHFQRRQRNRKKSHEAQFSRSGRKIRRWKRVFLVETSEDEENEDDEVESENGGGAGEEKSGTAKSKTTCKLCDKEFHTIGKLAHHVEVVHINITHPCPKCDLVFNRNTNLNRHMANRHSVGEEKTCNICHKTFKHGVALGCHKRNVHRNRNLSCKICGKSNFKSGSSLYNHRRFVHGDGPGSYICDQCPFVAKINSHLQKHVETVHPSPDLKFQCDECGRSYKNRVTLNAHKETHIQDFNHRCLFCSTKFNSVRTKRAHESDHHSIPDGHICRVCQKVCQTCPILEKHVLYEHSKDELEKLYYEPALLVSLPPPTTTKKINSANSGLSEEQLLRMIEDREGLVKNKGGRGKRSFLSQDDVRARARDYYQKPRLCQYCNLPFPNLISERYHVVEAHPEFAYRRCEECNIPFATTKQLQAHDIEKHGGVPTKKSCPHCDKVILHSDTLKSHIQAHQGPIKCDACGKEMKSLVALRTHKYKVHLKPKSRPFVEAVSQQRLVAAAQQEPVQVHSLSIIEPVPTTSTAAFAMALAMVPTLQQI